ncbi:regulatory-associated protein of mTOR [Wyeomyia smithii]|uniref:regulatory-associated protein of mTOR n=1 Tax=Wyeomyia smithii TaxID=174621 RepID=UPI0024680225|nr:regulatory-associated protein of mTOR [Wyeomyia smithii]XP_055550174.1 regulatory-associated protein of mTOR [Wyeomyia smithii]XP_055550175.1 regulatory-associated protein of mTOR [Wyeomyia smithii]
MIETTDKENDSVVEEEDDSKLPISFIYARHLGKIEGINCITQSWRVKERMKTVSVALVLCLNLGVDPPDVVKIHPCSRLECWIDPAAMSGQKAMELIASNLQKQYERWQPRARYKHSLDPTVEDVKKLCTSLRRNSKEERVLFHYNGHGVPRPTVNGEIWVFNRTYTQYIPLSIYDLQTWMGAPSIYVYDCSNAGIIVNSFNTFAEQHEKELEQMRARSGSTTGQSDQEANRNSPSPPVLGATTYKNCIQLAACAANQILPMNPQLPADLFTSCLTTPIRIALKWFILQSTSSLVPHVTEDLIDRIPGQLNDRRTMLGELNWIFTAITDTIAWNTLPRDLFQKLFRQDLLVASLFRNFLLAERILRSYDCTPISSPPLPQSYRHPMWSAWDLALDLALSQLPDILDKGKRFKHSPFFEEQLTAFQVWLEGSSEQRSPPEQLPIVLQVLLSQVHRLRALELLGHFLDLGPWAVNLALSVGIFPYVLKLLQSLAKELRPFLVFIWAKILAVDGTCQVDLIRDHGHKYFLAALQDTSPCPGFKGNHRVYAAFVLASIVHKFAIGQANAMQGQLVSICLDQLNDSNPVLRQWLAICLGHLWQNYEQARWSGVRDNANEKLYPLLSDPIPEVRAAAVYALGTFISSVTQRSDHANNIDRSTAMHLYATVCNDMSPLVRMELIASLQWMVRFFESQFVTVFLQESTTSHNLFNHHYHSLERNMNLKRNSSTSNIINVGKNAATVGSIYQKLWNGLNALAKDPFPAVAQMAQKVVEYVGKQGYEIAKEATTSEKSAGSMSLPPSPNTRINYLGGESPPTHNHLTQATAHLTPVPNKKKLHQISDSSEFAACSTQQQQPQSIIISNHGSPQIQTIQSDQMPPQSASNVNPQQSQSQGQPQASNSQPQMQQQQLATPIVTTNYIEWSVSFFARPSKFLNEAKLKNVSDQNSTEFLDRQSRCLRNRIVREEGREQQRRAVFGRLDTQSWSCRTQHTPTMVKLNPYDDQIAVAYKDRVILQDWSTDLTSSFIPFKQQPHVHYQSIFLDQNRFQMTPSTIAVSSLDFVNAHDVGLVLVGYSDSVIRVWRPAEANRESSLVTAWHGLFDFNSPTTAKVGTSELGLVMAWHQKTQTIMAAGEAKYIRLWDAERESKICDISSGSDATIIKLSCAPNGIFAAGCNDGSVRLFDRRCSPAEARFATFREHMNPILTVCLRDDCESLVSACTTSTVRLYDIRKTSTSVQHWSAGSDVSAMSIHSSADIVACATSVITIYGLDGTNLNTIRCNEGFMGTKKGVTSCLSFHKHKISLAAGFNDNTAAVFVTDRK